MVALAAPAYPSPAVCRSCLTEIYSDRSTTAKGGKNKSMSILWIILIVVLVLALLGFFSRGYW
jgi:uncharacterized BrkB/YihY/UPF0761 family membrane protein